MVELNRKQHWMQKALLTYGRLSRGMTLGVRAMVLRDDAHLLLVKHSYVPGWYLPGGAVDAGEHAQGAIIREIYEECGVRVQGALEPVSLYQAAPRNPRDHVMLFIARDWIQTDDISLPNREILEAQFFPLSDLPQDTAGGTQRRVTEYLAGATPSPIW